MLCCQFLLIVTLQYLIVSDIDAVIDPKWLRITRSSLKKGP